MIKDPHPAFLESMASRCRDINPRFEPRNSHVSATTGSRGPEPVLTINLEDIVYIKLERTINHLDQTIAIARNAPDGTWRIEGDEFIKVSKIASSFIDKLKLGGVVGQIFLEEIISEWIFDHRGHSPEGFGTHVMQEVRRAIKLIDVEVPLSGVRGNISFSLNGVRFAPQSGLLNKWFELRMKAVHEGEPGQLAAKHMDAELRSNYGDSYWASCSVQAEELEGKRVAYEEIATVVDLVRAFCVDGYHPLRYVGLVPRRKLLEGNFSCCAIDDSIQLSDAALDGQEFIWIDEHALKIMMRLGLGKAEAIYVKEDKTEMDIVVLNALRQLGKVSGLPTLSDKLVYGCTALEQVFLKDQNEPILASMPQRCAMVMEDSVADRKRLIAIIKSGYDFRSKRVHHGKDIEVNQDIFDFFQLLWRFKSKLVFLPDQFKTKSEMLSSLDDRLLTG